MRYLKTAILFIAALTVLIFTHETEAQSVLIMTENGQIADCTENKSFSKDKLRSANAITEDDYPYLKSIECLENGYFSDHRDLNLQLRNVDWDNNNQFVLEGEGALIDVEARYDEEGDLVEATLIKENTQVPQSVLNFIYSQKKFDGWRMTGNKKVVNDFDPYQTEYEVTMSNGKETQVLHFKEMGEGIAYLNE